MSSAPDYLAMKKNENGVGYPAGTAERIKAHVLDGGHVLLPTAWKTTKITKKTWESWNKVGLDPIYQTEKGDLRLRSGKKSVSLHFSPVLLSVEASHV